MTDTDYTDRATADAVTFEVLMNGLETLVDEMGEQVLRSCYSFVIWSRDFSCALLDREGELVMHGNQDLPAHVGTLGFHARHILATFAGDIHAGDVFLTNDPYGGGVHLNDVCVVRPLFDGGELIAFALCKGHWADMGGSVPGSFDVTAREIFREGLRIPAIRIVDSGKLRRDIVELCVGNTRQPADAEGDLYAQVEATRVAERELARLIARYGKATVLETFEEVQSYTERVARTAIGRLPDGVWETEQWLDGYPEIDREGLIPVRVRLEINGDAIHYDLTGSHQTLPMFLNGAFGVSTSGLYVGTKMFFPGIPMNAGFQRVVSVHLPADTIVNPKWPAAVAGGGSGAVDKIVCAVCELWSQVTPERALAPSFNLEYLLLGGRDGRSASDRSFMWYDWMAGGWGSRNGEDGLNGTSPTYCSSLALQPVEGQERLAPLVTTEHEFLTDSGGPGRFRGGVGVTKGVTLANAQDSVLSYMCDRGRAITNGIAGGLPSYPHGVWLQSAGEAVPRYLGTMFSDLTVASGDTIRRPASGGGGYGDPLQRDATAVLEDVIDGYVSIERARKDYGVVISTVDEELSQYCVDEEATAVERSAIAAHRLGWLSQSAHDVAARYRDGELDVLDVIRRYGVILHWGTGTLLERSTEQFRSMLQERAAAYW